MMWIPLQKRSGTALSVLALLMVMIAFVANADTEGEDKLNESKTEVHAHELEELRLFFTPSEREAALDKLPGDPIISENAEVIEKPARAEVNANMAKAYIKPSPVTLTYNGYLRHKESLVLFVDGRRLLDHPDVIRQDIVNEGASIVLWVLGQPRIELKLGESISLNN